MWPVGGIVERIVLVLVVQLKRWVSVNFKKNRISDGNSKEKQKNYGKNSPWED